MLLAWIGFSGEDDSFKVKIAGCKLKTEWTLREALDSYSQFHSVLLNLTYSKDPIFYILLWVLWVDTILIVLGKVPSPTSGLGFPLPKIMVMITISF